MCRQRVQTGLLLTLILSMLPGNGLYARSTDTISSEKHWTPSYYLGSYLKDTRNLFLSPLHWEGRDWAVAGLAGAGTLAGFSLDKKSDLFFRDHRSPVSELVSSNLLEPWGNYYSLGVLALLYTDGWVRDEPYHRHTALIGLEAYLLSGLFARIPKVLAGRHRPNQDEPPDPWRWDGPGFTNHSFVSGHAASVFAVATVIAERYREKTWVGVTSYTLASLTALSRVHDSKHWLSDVVAGSFLGWSVGKYLAGTHAPAKKGPALLPSPGGLAVTFSF